MGAAACQYAGRCRPETGPEAAVVRHGYRRPPDPHHQSDHRDAEEARLHAVLPREPGRAYLDQLAELSERVRAPTVPVMYYYPSVSSRAATILAEPVWAGVHACSGCPDPRRWLSVDVPFAAFRHSGPTPRACPGAPEPPGCAGVHACSGCPDPRRWLSVDVPFAACRYAGQTSRSARVLQDPLGGTGF